MSFRLHPQLKKDLTFVTDLELSSAFLFPSTTNPWVVLVPRINDIREWHQLSDSHQARLCREISTVSRWMEGEFQPDKINVGALGNMVPQLHVHVICRYKTDGAWPGAIWGQPQKCEEKLFLELLLKLKSELGV